MKKIIPIIDIISAVITFTILLFTHTSPNFIYVIMFSLFVGWMIPYIALVISAITIYFAKYPKLTLVFDILAFLLTLLLIFLVLKLYNSKLLIILIEYIYLTIIILINIIYLIIYFKKHPDLELKKIKELKKKNNGAIV